MKISIILPAYDEQENIEKAVEECDKVLPRHLAEYELVLVNDGSSDRTGEIIDKIAEQKLHVKALHHRQNKGLGAAVRTGVENSEYEYIFLSPSDLQFDIAEIKNFIDAAGNADIIAGYRVSRNYNWYRKMNTRANLLLLTLLFGLRVRDPNWVKLFKRDIFEIAPIRYEGFFWDSQVLIDAQKRGLKIKEIPAGIRDRVAGKASGSSPLRVFKTLLEMLKFRITNK
ncbi:MAG: glycosyltransferase family 2 protein [Candidatus Spechtbacterales bacterium]|nr:glycosyltransferase family 2 protein [Candidatus Spechtbacterales bacterium]